MSREWAADVIAQLRLLGISQKDLAKECGYSEPYISQVLRGRKDTERAKETIQATMDKLSKEARP